MRAALLLALLVAGVADARDRRCGKDRLNARTGDCVGYAFFEAFPATGAGTFGACSTTAPTGARGEALTFSRTGNATCSKQGLATTGIANGDLVVLSGNQPRVEPDSQGVLGLRVESSRTNLTIRSQDLTDAYWQKGGNLATPSVTTVSETAPDGSVGVSKISMTRPTTADYQYVQDDHTLAADGTYTGSLYVKAAPGFGGKIISLQGYTGTLNVGAVDVTLSEATWTRAVTTPQAQTAGSSKRIVAVGLGTAGASIGNVEFYAWGGQAEAGSYATSYTPTTSAAVVRNAETATFVFPALTVTAPWSVAATTQLPSAVATNARVGGAGGTTGLVTALFDAYASGGVLQVFSSQVSPNNYSTGLSVTASTASRYATYHDGTLFNGCVNATCAAGVARAWSSLANTTTLAIGQYTGAGAIDGIQSRICFQPGDATRCR